jgi:hypothetical protein
VSGFGAFPWFVMLFCLFCFFSFCSPLDVHSLTTQTGGQALWLKVEAIPAGGHPASYFSSTAALLGAYCLARLESWWWRPLASPKSMNHTGMPIIEYLAMGPVLSINRGAALFF